MKFKRLATRIQTFCCIVNINNMATDTVLVSIEIILNSKQIIPWTIIPVESSLTVDELCKKLFSGKFKEIEIVKEQIDENKGSKYDVFVGRNKTAENDKIFPTENFGSS